MLKGSFTTSTKFWTHISEDQGLTEWRRIGSYKYRVIPHSEAKVVNVFISQDRLGISQNNDLPSYFFNSRLQMVCLKFMPGDVLTLEIQKDDRSVYFEMPRNDSTDPLEQHLRRYCISLDYQRIFVEEKPIASVRTSTVAAHHLPLMV